MRRFNLSTLQPFILSLTYLPSFNGCVLRR